MQFCDVIEMLPLPMYATYISSEHCHATIYRWSTTVNFIHAKFHLLFYHTQSVMP